MPKFRSLKINPMVQEAEFSKLARRFIAIKKAEGLSERTIADYLRTFSRLKSLIDETTTIYYLDSFLISFFGSFVNCAPTTYNIP